MNLFNFVKSSLFKFKDLKRLSFGFFLLFINMFLLLAYQDNSSLFTPLLIYTLLLLGFIGGLDQKIPMLKMPLVESLIKYLVTFLTLAFGLSLFSSNYTSGFSQIAILYGIIVSSNEDILFVGVIPTYLTNKFGSAGRGIGALIFALFHIPAYIVLAGSFPIFLMQLFGAFIINLLFQFIASNPKLGLPVTMALHGVYDLFVGGYLAMIVGSLGILGGIL